MVPWSCEKETVQCFQESINNAIFHSNNRSGPLLTVSNVGPKDAKGVRQVCTNESWNTQAKVNSKKKLETQTGVCNLKCRHKRLKHSLWHMLGMPTTLDAIHLSSRCCFLHSTPATRTLDLIYPKKACKMLVFFNFQKIRFKRLIHKNNNVSFKTCLWKYNILWLSLGSQHPTRYSSIFSVIALQ